MRHRDLRFIKSMKIEIMKKKNNTLVSVGRISALDRGVTGMEWMTSFCLGQTRHGTSLFSDDRGSRSRQPPAPGATGGPGPRGAAGGAGAARTQGSAWPARPLTEVCMTSMHRLSERRLRVLTPSLTAVVNRPPLFSRLLKCH